MICFNQQLKKREQYLKEHHNKIIPLKQQLQEALEKFKADKENDFLYKFNHLDIPKFQTGGAIDGLEGGKLKGYGGGDRNLALLEDGEFILRKEAVKNVGLNYLEKLNNSHIKLPKFAVGGMVGGATSTTSTTPNNTVNLNLNLENTTYKLRSDAEVANALERHIRGIS